MGLEGFFQQPWNHTKKLGCVLLPRQAAFAQVFNVLQDGARECALKPDLWGREPPCRVSGPGLLRAGAAGAQGKPGQRLCWEGFTGCS